MRLRNQLTWLRKSSQHTIDIVSWGTTVFSLSKHLQHTIGKRRTLGDSGKTFSSLLAASSFSFACCRSIHCVCQTSGDGTQSNKVGKKITVISLWLGSPSPPNLS
jgi:hypothetical protein